MKLTSKSNQKIKDLLERAATLVEKRDINNVGMPWPGDTTLAKKIRDIKNEIDF